MPIRVILDTDIGTDVDDCLALALLLQSPELQLEGVTCVYGDVDLRARMVVKLLKLHGSVHIPVMAGARKPLLGLHSVYWEGHEGQGLLEPGDESLPFAPESAPDYIVRTVMANPGQIHLIAIGPLTNIALAFLKEPRLAKNLAGLTIMGGVFQSRLSLPPAEHNIVCDPESAHIVFLAGASITLVPLDMTTQVRITSAMVAAVRARGTPFHHAVAEQAERYHRIKTFGWTYLHDPLAIGVVTQPGFVDWTPVHLLVETAGRHTSGATVMVEPTADKPANVSLATQVRATEFETFFIDRLTS